VHRSGILGFVSDPLLVLDHLSVAIGVDRFFGSLVVAPGALCFTPKGWGNKLNVADAPTLVHEGQRVTLVHGRLLPPWMNSGVVLVDPAQPNQWTGVVLVTSWQRRRVVRALADAGFEVADYATLFSAGGNLGTIAELDRFTRSHA